MIAMEVEWRSLGATALPGEVPFGIDPKEDPSFELIEAEVDKLQSDPAGVDWDTVIVHGVDLLGARSKDWRVACRLAAALYQVYRYDGLAVGLAILRDFIDESRWEQISPPIRRVRLRGAFLEWLSERLTSSLERAEDEPAAEDADALASAVESLTEIDSRLSLALGDHAPILNRLINEFDRLYAAAKSKADERARAAVAAQPPPSASSNAVASDEQLPRSTITHPAATDSPANMSESATDSAAPARPVGSAATAADSATAATEGFSANAQRSVDTARNVEVEAQASPAAIPPVQLTGGIEKNLRQIKNAMLGVASSLRRANSADPRAYLLLRYALWLDIERLPPNQNRVTGIPEPSLERRKHFEQLQQQGEWIKLIDEVEKTLAAGSFFWLDGHRLVAIALEEAGRDFGDARRTMLSSLSAMLRRFPGVEKLKFAQGSGFADELTLAWLSAEVIAPASEPPAGADSTSESLAPWVAATRESEALAMKGKAREGLQLFREGLTNAGSARERFCWELAQARACADAGFREIAARQARHLAELAERYQLDDWEPALSLELAKVFLTVHDSSAQDATWESREQDRVVARMMERLCRFDVVAATEAGHT